MKIAPETRVLFTLLLAATLLTGCNLQKAENSGADPSEPGTTTSPSSVPVDRNGLTPEPSTAVENLQPLLTDQPVGKTLWVNSESGNDQNTGLNEEDAVRTINAAVTLASPGVEIRIAPGVYRESVIINSSGTQEKPIKLISDDGLGSVVIRGSEPSSSLSWSQLERNTIGLPAEVQPSNIYFADLSTWELIDTPRYIVLFDENDQISTRYLPAREPDYRVDTEWKFHEFWWAANGGHTIARCEPTINPDQDCDLGTRSYTELTDTNDDTEPAGIEPGNLMIFGDLTGATLVAMDAHHAHYVYRSTIVSSNPNSGIVTVMDECEREGEPGLGWGSKYYVENHPALLDQPGEWWYDRESNILYFWSPTGENPSTLNLEISRRDVGFDASYQSNIVLDGIQIELFNRNGYQIVQRKKNSASSGNRILNSLIHYVDKGVVLYHYVTSSNPDEAISGFHIENSEFAYLDSVALDSYFGWYEAPSPDTFTHAGIRDILIRNNEFHHLGFNSSDRSAVGIRIFFPDELKFEGNHIHHIAQNGMHLHLSLVDSQKTYGFSADEIKIGKILVKDNLFEKTCQAAFDCSGFKIGGSNRPDTHVFREVLITGNTFRHVFGWSYVAQKRRISQMGDGNGFYLDYASGIHFYRNLAYNNSGAGIKLSCLWRDGEVIIYNNVLANNYMYGIKTTGMGSCDNHNGSVMTRIVNNIFTNNGKAALELLSNYTNTFGDLTINNNLYFQNGWHESLPGTQLNMILYRDDLTALRLRSLTSIKNKTGWEDQGIQANPGMSNYDIEDHSLFLYPDYTFSPTSNSVYLLNKGSGEIPDSLAELLNLFKLTDSNCGGAYDIGQFEICN